MHGFGPVEIEEDEPVFHARWEGRVVGIFVQVLLGGWANLDAFRHGIETIAPAQYLRASYFERWRLSIEKNLVGAGALTEGEIEERVRALERGLRVRAAMQGARSAPPHPPQPGFVRDIAASPRFRAGEAVRARNLHPPGHTRLPRYVRGRRGRVERVYSAFVFPDSNAHGLGENPQYLYHVRFEGSELWGESAEPRSSVGVDLFESYLEPCREQSA